MFFFPTPSCPVILLLPFLLLKKPKNRNLTDYGSPQSAHNRSFILAPAPANVSMKPENRVEETDDTMHVQQQEEELMEPHMRVPSQQCLVDFLHMQREREREQQHSRSPYHHQHRQHHWKTSSPTTPVPVTMSTKYQLPSTPTPRLFNTSIANRIPSPSQSWSIFYPLEIFHRCQDTFTTTF
jgi:hypothetical protein